jgi:hypothetical protein
VKRGAGIATLIGIAIALAHAALVPALMAATARETFEVRWPGTLAADTPADGHATAGAAQSREGGAPGLTWTRWTVAYRGGIERSVGVAQLVGPFQDTAAPPCSGRLVVGQQLLDDGKASPNTVAGIIAAELTREMKGTSQPGAGTFRRVEDVKVRWAELDPRDLGLFPAAAMRAPQPTGMLRAEVVLVFDRVRVPVTIGALPRIDGGSLGFTIGMRARLDFENRVLDWVNARVGGDAIVSRIASGQLDTALLAALGAPPPLTLPGGPTLTVELCGDRAIEMREDAWAAVPLRWKLGAPVDARDGGPAIRPPLRGPMQFPPPATGAALTLDLDLDGLNGLLFELWRSGWLDARLDELAAHERFNRDETVMTYLTLRLSPLRLALPPVLRPGPGGAMALDLAARVDIADGALVTPALAWASVAIALRAPANAGDPPLAADVGVTALELSCEPSPGLLRPCYGDVVAAIRDAAPSTHAMMADTLTSTLTRIFVDQKLSASGAPAALRLVGARGRTLADGEHRGVRIELDASLITTPARP